MAQGQRLQKDRRKVKQRRSGKTREEEMIDLLRRQARCLCAANKRASASPIDPMLTLEWKAADLIEVLLGALDDRHQD